MIARKFKTLYVACISFVGERWAKETLTQEASRVPRELPSRQQGAPGSLSLEFWELISATVTPKEDSTTSSVTLLSCSRPPLPASSASRKNSAYLAVCD